MYHAYISSTTNVAIERMDDGNTVTEKMNKDNVVMERMDDDNMVTEKMNKENVVMESVDTGNMATEKMNEDNVVMESVDNANATTEQMASVDDMKNMTIWGNSSSFVRPFFTGVHSGWQH